MHLYFFTLFNSLFYSIKKKTHEEYLKILTSKETVSLKSSPSLQNETNYPRQTNGNIPAFVDWRFSATSPKGKALVVSPVRQQGACGSCWAFASVCSLEGQYLNVTTEEYVEFSEQDLVDCDLSNDGCNGGFRLKAYRFIQGRGGILSGKDYSYTEFKVGFFEFSARPNKCFFLLLHNFN